MTTRDLSRYSRLPVTSFASLEAFMAAPVPAGVVTIDYNGAPLDVLIQPAEGANTTIVIFHAATGLSATRPVFTGLGFTRGINANLVCVSDPSLEFSDDLTLAWFAGNRSQPLQRDLPEVLAHVLGGLETHHAVFFGASGGGYAALYYSAQMPGSLAIAANPQTIVPAYTAPSVLRYVSKCFATVATVDEAAAMLADRGVIADLRDVYRAGTGNTVAYIQNIPDGQHVRRHMDPFLEALPREASVHLLDGDWGPGHQAPPKELLREILDAVVDCVGDWTTALAGLDFTPQSYLQRPCLTDFVDNFNDLVEAAAEAMYEADTTAYTEAPWREAPESRQRIWRARAYTALEAADVPNLLGQLEEYALLVPGDR